MAGDIEELHPSTFAASKTHFKNPDSYESPLSPKFTRVNPDSENIRIKKLWRLIEKTARYDRVSLVSKDFIRSHNLPHPALEEWNKQKYQRGLEYFFCVLGTVLRADQHQNYLNYFRENMK